MPNVSEEKSWYWSSYSAIGSNEAYMMMMTTILMMPIIMLVTILMRRRTSMMVRKVSELNGYENEYDEGVNDDYYDVDGGNNSVESNTAHTQRLVMTIIMMRRMIMTMMMMVAMIVRRVWGSYSAIGRCEGRFFTSYHKVVLPSTSSSTPHHHHHQHCHQYDLPSITIKIIIIKNCNNII